MVNDVRIPKVVMSNLSTRLINVKKDELTKILNATLANSVPLDVYLSEPNIGKFNGKNVVFRDGKIIESKTQYNIPSKENEVVTIVSDKYQLVNHKHIFNDVLNVLDDNKINYSIPSIYVDQREGRNRIYGHIALDDIDFDVDGSKVSPTIDVFNSTDGSLSAGILFGAYRMICSNGMRIGVDLKIAKVLHTPSFFSKFNFSEIFDSIMVQFTGLKEEIEKMQTIKLQKIMLQGLQELGFNTQFIKNYDVILEKYMLDHNETVKGDTVWGLVATATNFISNHLMNKNVQNAMKQQSILYRFQRQILAAA